MLIISVLGQSGSGKDTFADYICTKKRFQKVALADPIKRFCQKVFGFSDTQLWGPTSARNTPDSRFTGRNLSLQMRQSERNLWEFGKDFVDEVSRPSSPPKKRAVAVSALWGWLEDCWTREDLAPRYPLQTLGTEWGRGIDPELWLFNCYRVAIPSIMAGTHFYTQSEGLRPNRRFFGKRKRPDGIIVPDTRFKNEVEYGQGAGALVGRLKRQGVTGQVTSGAKNHASEMEQLSIPDGLLNFILDVPEGLPNYYAAIDKLARDLPGLREMKLAA